MVDSTLWPVDGMGILEKRPLKSNMLVGCWFAGARPWSWLWSDLGRWPRWGLQPIQGTKGRLARLVLEPGTRIASKALYLYI